MEQTENTSLRVRRNNKQIQELLDQFENSDGDVGVFCKIHNINLSTFHKWQSRYQRKTDMDSSPSFITLAAPPSHSNASLFAEVGTIKIYQPVTASYLKELVSL